MTDRVQLSPPRLAARVSPPGDYEDPYLVELRLLNMGDVVDCFHVNVSVESGSIPDPARTETVALLPRAEHRWFVPLLLREQTSALLRVEARSEHTDLVRRLHVVVPDDTEVDTGQEVQVVAPEPRRRLGLLSDHPVEPGTDMLGYGEVAGRMADFLLDVRGATPFALGVQGGWGSGKSSLMRLLEHEIEERAQERRGRVKVAWFNAWTAEGAGALTALIRSVLDQMDPSVLRRVLRRTRRSSWLTTPFVVLATWLGLRALADDLWQRFRVDASQRNQIRKEIQDAVTAWADRERPVDERRQLVVFIDDLDRCSPDNVVQVLEAIRLYLDAPGLAFVIGYDQAVVGEALARARESFANAGHLYLEKIIQVDYAMPVPDIEQMRALARACARECGVADLLAEEDLTLIVRRSERNPRRLKRFLNTFVLSHRLDSRSAQLRAEEHIKMLVLRMYFPGLFRLIILEPERDVLGQLMELARLRAAVKADRDTDDEMVTWLCEAIGVARPRPGETAGDVLARLEELAPDVVVDLSRDTDLFSLVWSLGSTEQRADLLHRIRDRLELFEQASSLLEPQKRPDRCPMCAAPQTGAEQDFCDACGAYLDG
ncbi:KAP family P-loop NTPase fold protein [Actinosynnema sp. CS-041913]|uniref:KAP family P-loop NTPase fold protein n=1 Tax=Actinosynnema sp. CS-041913 TaxID=3239917 RepID=UPI003D9364B9